VGSTHNTAVDQTANQSSTSKTAMPTTVAMSKPTVSALMVLLLASRTSFLPFPPHAQPPWRLPELT